MGDLEPIVLGLLVAVAALSILARAIGVPYPILMVIGGLGLGLIPGAPEVALDPELVLVVFLPPLLYIGAFFTSLRDVRRDARAITMLSVGLVAATACAVAAAAHHLVGLPWAAAFTLGAIVSPTDPLAATQIMGRLGAPRRIAIVLQGEGLVNDATALVLYRAAVGAAVGGAFSLADAGAPFPGRDLILFITFCVIMATLVFHGLTMPLLIRRLGIGDDGASDEEELRARLAAARAALDRIEELADEDWTRPDTLERMRALHAWRKRRFAARAGRIEDDGYEEQSVAYQRALREVLDAQRRAVVEMRNRGEISNDVMHQIERELDLEDSRLEVPRGSGGGGGDPGP